MQLSPHFTTDEFTFNPGDPVFELEHLRELAQQLEVVRAALGGHGIHITPHGGLRTHEQALTQNPDIRSHSQHEYGRAADFVVDDGAGGHVSPAVVASTLEALIDAGEIRPGGIGLYDGFVHYDTGPSRRWRGDGQRYRREDLPLVAVTTEQIQTAAVAQKGQLGAALFLGIAGWLAWRHWSD